MALESVVGQIKKKMRWILIQQRPTRGLFQSFTRTIAAQFQLGDIVAWGQAAPDDSYPAVKRQSW